MGCGIENLVNSIEPVVVRFSRRYGLKVQDLIMGYGKKLLQQEQVTASHKEEGRIYRNINIRPSIEQGYWHVSGVAWTYNSGQKLYRTEGEASQKQGLLAVLERIYQKTFQWDKKDFNKVVPA